MFNYCPKCRRPSPDFIDNKKISCPDCGFTIYQNTAAAVAVLVKVEKRYIILRRGREPGKGMLDLPGGFIDPGESAEDSCRREIKEELGVEISNLRYISSHPNIYPYKDVTYHTCDMFFIAECMDKNFVRQEDEIDEILLLDRKEIDIEQFAFESIRILLDEQLHKISRE
ncbi:MULTISPECIES: NUDIX domain-containing protein [unclassified Oceanispirochaeta]|uniref:NUDIX hydrolase n=1 Tax=unclassified Oceanispirochaeta TaxID=2635722 RepID=UPI000E08FF28|nr:MULTISPECIES: NUDIX domain-containing protein [unclassified Oceanispirochaeta]MBF9014781.1 NUDIX domain-containing protein [Oceanispirochaeta sp. M2]NPD71037.1 NUDIX domain-containing protein [Oceanispirochaeta sp. M1]RDG33870.1 NUDIX domain-containing protein [Oceanispirochaeta sp. M1]